MIFHILNGDALVDRFHVFDIPGAVIINRECLIEGNLQGDYLPDFFETRAKYLSKVYGESRKKYFKNVVGEFSKLIEAPKDSEFNFWFGYDLFCQANLWFLLSILHKKDASTEVFIVYPSFLKKEDRWNDFGGASVDDLRQAYANRTELSSQDVSLANNLWEAYRSNDLVSLRELSHTRSNSFPYLQEVIQAHLDRFPITDEKNRPERVVEDIVRNVSDDFHVVFREFFKREGVYGFGDSQVKQIYDKVL